MKRMSKNLVCAVMLILTGAGILRAQQTAVYQNPEANYRKALELFEKEKYSAARKVFQELITEIKDKKSAFMAEAIYYNSVCASRLQHRDAAFELQRFINSFPEHTLLPLAWFELGNYQYSQSRFSEALEAYQAVNIDRLPDELKNEYYFKSGYSSFSKNKSEDAKKSFAKVKDSGSKYAGPATYYYAHVMYAEGNYQTALESFLKLKDDENFGSIAPFYITQIYYLQGNYAELLKVAPLLLESGNVKRAPEIARLIGEAYYKTQKYAEALPYLRQYRDQSARPLQRGDYYQLAYTYYKTEVYDTAIVNFLKCVEKGDTLTQNSLYHLGYCYIKTDQKKLARATFQEASKIDIDKKMQEDALYNYAKLCYEMASNPFNDAIKAIQLYLKEYPNSDKSDEMNGYLVNVYMTTKNYKDALASLEKIKRPDRRLSEAYQRIAFNRAVECYNEAKYDDAAILFNKALMKDFSPTINAYCKYWRGEIRYKTEDYEAASADYKEFQLTQGAFNLPLFNLSNYNLGYTYFKQKKYSNALEYFRKFLYSPKNEDLKIVTDAYLRTADCYFMAKDYKKAIENYDLAADQKLQDGDYALYQKALCQGVLGNFEGKTQTFYKLITNYKNSTLIPATKFELANTYLILDNQDKALFYFQDLIEYHPSCSFTKDAMLKSGLIYYNKGDNDKALATYQKIVTQYPGTSESKDALTGIRKIYVDQNRVDEFFSYMKNLPFANVTNAEQDSITYIAAEMRYMNGDCEAAEKGFSSYLEKFPDGSFTESASFYKAECDNKSSQFEKALSGYEYVISKPKTKFTEKAMLNAANIAFKLNQFQKSQEYYLKLVENAETDVNIITGRLGLLRCEYNLNNFYNAITAAQQLLTLEKITDEIKDEAHLTIAHSAMAIDSVSMAQTEYSLLSKSKNGEISAESRYQLANIQFTQGNTDEAEKMIFDILSAPPSSEFWLAKTHILWADIYVKKEKFVHAKQVLQSIIDNYDGPDLVKVAYEKRNAIIDMEKKNKEQQNNKAKATQDSDEIKINLNGPNGNSNNE